MNYDALADTALAGKLLTREAALAVLQSSDDDIDAVLQAAFRVRAHYCGRRVKLCLLQNAKSGWCPEDCNYCSQSKVSTADIEKYGMLPIDQLVDGARFAVQQQARRYCMVTSGRGPVQGDIDHFCEATRTIKQEFPWMEVCCCLGIMDAGQARQLKDAGVGWVNHNLNTSERFHQSICSTHTYQDRVRTVQNVRAAGLQTCCGGIVGMGEDDHDIVEMAFAFRELQVDSIPINFLHPVKGTPLGQQAHLAPARGLRILCLMRFVNPASEIRAAGGRELILKDQQANALYAANSIFIEGYLTTPGDTSSAALALIRDMGFEPEVEEAA